MPPQHPDNLTLKDEIINAFRPIEQLFRIMDTSGAEVDETIIRCYAEIGLELTGNFRERIEKGRVHGGGVNSGVVQAGGDLLQPGRDGRGGHRVKWL